MFIASSKTTESIEKKNRHWHQRKTFGSH